MLALPSLERTFHLFISVDQVTALGVLTQQHGGKKQPIAYLSKNLLSHHARMARMHPSSVSHSLLTEESRKRTSGGSLIVSTPHQVRVIFQQRVGRWLTDSRILKYEATRKG
jgi:hypothetical protein